MGKPKKHIKPNKKGERLFNVFYTPVPYQVEMLIRAKTLKQAEKKVKDFLGNTVESVKGGWEIDPKYNE